jgi:hypothetical protein
MVSKKFTITCNKCGSNDVFLVANHDGDVSIMCNNDNCDNCDIE